MHRGLRIGCLFVLLAAGGCGSGPATAPPTAPPTPQCAWQFASQGRPDDTATIQTALQDQGLQVAAATVTDQGERCGGQFQRQYSEFRATLQVADLADSATLHGQADKALAVIRTHTRSASDKIILTFAAGGQTVIRDYPGK